MEFAPTALPIHSGTQARSKEWECGHSVKIGIPGLDVNVAGTGGRNVVDRAPCKHVTRSRCVTILIVLMVSVGLCIPVQLTIVVTVIVYGHVVLVYWSQTLVCIKAPSVILLGPVFIIICL